MNYNIYRNNQNIASVSATGELTEKLFGEETLTMNFSLSQFIQFKIGDSVAVYGKSYYIATEPIVEKISTREYKYQLTFNGIKYRLAEVQYFFYDDKNQLTIPEFSIMGNAQKMLELLVANANRVQSGWSVGKVEDTEHKLVDFSNYNCLGALTRISDEFGLEFWVDADKSIHLTERKRASGYTFAYGQSKGLKSISRTPYTEASLITRLYAKGAERNIPKGYRDGQKALRMPVPFLEKNTDIYGIVEHTQTFDEIYPKRVGVVTEVYENNPLQFTDSTLDFDLNAYNEYGSTILIAGTSAKVIFQTGDLAGYTLEIKQYGFNSATKTFTLLKNKDEKSFEIPSANFRPKVGDKYILVDIMMPEKYVANAEAELQAEAQEYLEKNSRQRFIYSVVPDPLYLKEIRAKIVLGETIKFTDPDFNLDDEIRVVSLTRDIRNPYKISFEIAEQATIVQIVRNYIEKEKKDIAIKKEQKTNAEMARRSYLFAEEIKDNVFDNEGYFDTEKIKPLSIETGHISVGSRMQQFMLPNVILTLSDDNLRLKNTAGEMVHLTINENAPRSWNIAQNETPNFSGNFNYIYLKADKIGSNAVFIVSEQKIMLDSDPIFYCFLVGSVSSVIDGVRRIKTNYGFTQISPNEITTGRLSSANGANWIDLLQDRIEINAKVSFAPNSPALTQVQNMVDNVSIGGRNLVLQSKSSKSSNGGWIIYPLSDTDINGEYTLQIWLENTTPRGGGVGFGNASSYDGHYFDYPYFQNGVYTKTIKINKGANTHLCIWVNAQTTISKIKLEKGNKATDWTPAPEDVETEILVSKTESINASKAYADAQDNLAKIASQAYADGKITQAEQRAIIDASNKAEAAKTYAQAQDMLLKEQLQAYADGIVDAEEQARITQAQQSLAAAKAYADAQDNLAKIASQAYADGVVDAEEQRAIADATTKMELAKQHAQGLVNNISVGGRNYYSKQSSVNPYFGAIAIKRNEINGLELMGNQAKPSDIVPIRIGDVIKSNGWWTVSFEAKSNADNVNLNVDINDALDKNFVLNREYQKFSLSHNVTNHSASHNFIDFNVRYMRYEIKDLKIEKGNKATDWTPAPEDVESQIMQVQNTANTALGLTQAQVTNITALQDKTDFLSTTAISGNAVATGTMIVGNGLGANAGLTGLGGNQDAFLWGGSDYQNRNNAPISLHRDGFFRVRNAQGRVIFEIGQKNGNAVFDIYDDNGNKVAGIGQRGIEFLGYIAESYTENKFLKINSSWNDDNAIKKEIKNKLVGQKLASAKPPISEDNNWVYVEVSINTDTTSWYYQAGNNFETAHNTQYVGYYASKNKLGNKTPDGIYATYTYENVLMGNVGSSQTADAPVVPGQDYYDGEFELNITLYHISDGKIINQKNIQLNSNLHSVVY